MTGDHVPLRRRVTRPGVVLAVAGLGVCMAFLDATIVNVAFPAISRSFPDTSIAGLSWVLNAYNIVFAAFLVAAGALADLLGRKRMFRAGLVVFVGASVLCAAAPSTGFLVAARALQALGAAILVPSSLALVLDAFPARRRAHGVALWTTVAALAAGIGPSLGGVLVSVSGWRSVFLVNLPVGVAAFVLTRRLLVESRAPGRRRLPDLLGSLFFAAAVAALTLAIIKGGEWGWANARTVASLAVAAGLGAVLMRRCRRHPVPVVDLALLRVRACAVANASTVVGAAGFFAYTLTNVLFLTSVWHFSELQAGLGLTPGAFVAIAAGAAASRAAARIGYRAILVPGAAVWALALVYLITQVGPERDFVGEWLPGLVLLGLGAGLTFPSVTAAAVASAPGERFASATAINSVARQVGAVIGIAVVVAILGAPGQAAGTAVFDACWAFSALCMFALVAGGVAMGRLDLASHAVDAEQPPAPNRPPAPLPAGADRAPAVARLQSAVPETPAQFLGRVSIFAGLSDAMREELAARCSAVRVEAGAALFRQGDPGDSLYVVRGGRLEVLTEATEPTVVNRLRRGDVLGELALLSDEPRAASVRAQRDSELLRLDRAHFEALLAEVPELALALARALGSQLRTSRVEQPTTRSAPVTIAVVGLDPALDAPDIARRLAAALARHGRVAWLDGTETAACQKPDAVLAAYAPLVERAERTHDHVVLLASGQLDDPWTAFCIGQADRVLALTGGAPLADGVDGLHGCDLVGCDVQPGSAALADAVEALRPAQAFSLRTGAALDAGIARLGRRLARRSVGLVLSGGGARALSHIGVIDELLAAGITIDRVAGVSMGAYVGAMLAMGRDPDEIDAYCFEEWVRRNPLNDYTLPRKALIRGERVRAMFHRAFGQVAIEELDLGFSCGTAELHSGELVRHRFGALWERVAMSMTLPGLAPPVVSGRRVFVDGGVIDNLPVRSMAGDGEGPIIAVDATSGFGLARRADADESAPPLRETLTRVFLLGCANTAQEARRWADLVINPRSDGIGLLEFHQLDRAREAGRRAAREALADAPPELFAAA